MPPTLVTVGPDAPPRAASPPPTTRSRPAYPFLHTYVCAPEPPVALHAAVTVAADRQWVRTVRYFASAVLSRWAVAGEDLDASLLIVGELAANAAQHGRSDLAVLLSLHDRVLCIDVMDSGSASEREPGTAPPADQEHGRGLDIVAALADHSETHRRASGWHTRACVRVASAR